MQEKEKRETFFEVALSLPPKWRKGMTMIMPYLIQVNTLSFFIVCETPQGPFSIFRRDKSHIKRQNGKAATLIIPYKDTHGNIHFHPSFDSGLEKVHWKKAGFSTFENSKGLLGVKHIDDGTVIVPACYEAIPIDFFWEAKGKGSLILPEWDFDGYKWNPLLTDNESFTLPPMAPNFTVLQEQSLVGLLLFAKITLYSLAVTRPRSFFVGKYDFFPYTETVSLCFCFDYEKIGFPCVYQ
ncbi:MAG TPA: hypothetical protein PKC14_04410 [Candidatus Absconditabacterales bacterium]|nr:hypothetical protein [Candidatus Absconditabacterales bacterium]